MGTKLKKHSGINEILKTLPKVDALLLEVLENSAVELIPRSVVLKAVRETIEAERARILESSGKYEKSEKSLSVNHAGLVSEVMVKIILSMQPELSFIRILEDLPYVPKPLNRSRPLPGDIPTWNSISPQENGA